MRVTLKRNSRPTDAGQKPGINKHPRSPWWAEAHRPYWRDGLILRCERKTEAGNPVASHQEHRAENPSTTLRRRQSVSVEANTAALGIETFLRGYHSIWLPNALYILH